jgi:hypothetical protein
MELEEIKAKFDQEIGKFLSRTKINHVVCMAPLHTDGTSWTEAECDDFLAKSSYNKLPISNIFLLNKNSKIKFQSDEYNALNKSLRKCAQFLTDHIIEFCKDGENQYELNELIRNAFQLIDSSIAKMTYKSWQNEVLKNNPGNTFFLVFKNKKISKHGVYIDIETHCRHLIEQEFGYREILLYRLKDYLIDIYSRYLLLPTIGGNPKITYTCSSTDICELLMAIGNWNEITDSEKLKSILMEMFGISKPVFNKASHEIRNRSSSKSIFVKKLSDNLDKIPATWKTSK